MPLRGTEAVSCLAGELVRIGFRRKWRSPTGTRYLYWPVHRQFELRISDHRWSGWSAQRQCQVVHSVIITEIESRDAQNVGEACKKRYLERIAERLQLATT